MRTINPSDLDLVLYNLGKRGFTLSGIDYESEKPIIPITELIIRLVRDIGHPRGLEGLAFVIDKYPPDYEGLAREALKEGVQNQVGYILDGTFYVLKKHKPNLDFSKLEEAINFLYERRNPEDQLLGRLDIPRELEILSENRAPEDFKWRIIGGVTFKQMEVQYLVYNNHALNEYKRKFARAS